jgi:hypothetical protein
MSSVQRPVSLHGNDTVSNDEVHRCRRTDIENASMNALPAQNILGPAIFHARHDADMFFMPSVTPAQWWVLIFGIDTMKPDASTVRGSHR